jgi:amino acid adenylation domain-containing protein
MRNDIKNRPSNDYEPFPREALDQSIGARFDEIARRFPDKLAVRTRKHSWSYAELNARAEKLAEAINGHEISRPAPILLLFDHDAPAIAAVLAVLKAGHFYCALDPAAPLEQNKAILQSLTPGALVCDQANLDASEKLADGTILILKTDDAPAKSDRAVSSIQVSPAALAYVFFTSGTTGKPKGVMDSHRNVLHNILRYTNNLRITSDDRLTLLQTLNFSGSVSSLFCALLNGATIYPFDLRREGPAALADWIAEQAITIYHSVPSIFRLIAGEGRRFAKLRIIRLEGDQASPTDAALFQRNFHPACRLVNGLGATECGIVRQFFLTTDSPLPTPSLPIGYPVEDMEVFLLDDDGRITPPGEIGEIAVKSRYLAVGYWQQPDLTSETFRSSLDDPEARIYRTGDLGRLDENACLDYLGRKDSQEKVRGRRVNLANIEAEFLLIEGVREAVALVRPDREGKNQIVVYYTQLDDQPVNIDEVWRRLRKQVESHSLPSALMKLDRLPLNANGKVDRRALPHPHKQRLLTAPPVPAKTPSEIMLIAIWKDLLGLDQIGTDDSFLELGGDSLQFMRMVNRVEQTFGQPILIADFFLSPRVSTLAKMLDGGSASSTDSSS